MPLHRLPPAQGFRKRKTGPRRLPMTGNKSRFGRWICGPAREREDRMASRPPAYSDQDRRTLHFYPAGHRLIWFVDGEPVIFARAWGGKDPSPGFHYNVMDPQQTTPSRYVIDSYGPHLSERWKHSRISWRTPLKVDPEGKLVYQTGLVSHPWRRVEDRVPGFTAEVAEASYHLLYGKDAGIPDSWVFSDFGPFAVRYFIDKIETVGETVTSLFQGR
jgi:hypothetical protein